MRMLIALINIITESKIFQRFCHFIGHYFKEITIAVILAIAAAWALDPYLESHREKTAAEILKSNLRAVATLIVYDSGGKAISQGSGLFIDNNGRLVTNYHVIKGGKRVEAKLPTGAYYKAKSILEENPEEDLAILQFDAQDTPSVKLDESGLVEHGQKIFVIGTPVGLESTVAEGIVSNPKRNLQGQDFIQFTAPISPGNSGGGLFNTKGDVIGITTESIDIPATEDQGGTQNLNFAVPVNRLKASLSGEPSPLNSGGADYYYSLGNLADGEFKTEKAIEFYKKAISLNNKHTQAYIGLGGDYFMLKRYDLEVKCYELAVQSDSTNVDAHYYLGTAYEDVGQIYKAITEYENALGIDPDYTQALHDLAILYVAIGERAKARSMLPHLQAIDPGWGRIVRLLLK